MMGQAGLCSPAGTSLGCAGKMLRGLGSGVTAGDGLWSCRGSGVCQTSWGQRARNERQQGGQGRQLCVKRRRWEHCLRSFCIALNDSSLGVVQEEPKGQGERLGSRRTPHSRKHPQTTSSAGPWQRWAILQGLPRAARCCLAPTGQQDPHLVCCLGHVALARSLGALGAPRTALDVVGGDTVLEELTGPWVPMTHGCSCPQPPTKMQTHKKNTLKAAGDQYPRI